MRMENANSWPLRLFSWKKAAKAGTYKKPKSKDKVTPMTRGKSMFLFFIGTYKKAKSKDKVTPMTRGKSMFLFFMLSNTLYTKERFTRHKNTLAKIMVVNTMARVVSSACP